MKPENKEKLTLAKQVISQYLEDEGILGYDEHILSILMGRPNYYVNSALATATDEHPSYYTGWEDDSEYDMLDKFFEWEGLLGYTDLIWQRFEHPENYVEEKEAVYEVEVALKREEVEDLIRYFSVEVVSSSTNDYLPPDIEMVTLRGDRESLLGAAHFLQSDDIEWFGGYDMDDDDIVENFFDVVTED